MPNNTIIRVSTQAELKALPPSDGMTVLLLGKTNVYDNLGGFYQWDASASGADDNVYMKSFASNSSASGRWVRFYQNATNLAQGILRIEGGIKTFWGSATTVSGGSASINLTLDNADNGPPIFTEIWSNRSEVLVDAANVTDLITSGRKTQNADLRQTTHYFSKPSPVTITVGFVGVLQTVTAIPAGMSVRFRIEGI